MSCEELITYLSGYIDEELDEDLTREARQHLATCHNCQIVLSTTQRTILLGRGQLQRTIPADRRGMLYARLQQAFLREPPH